MLGVEPPTEHTAAGAPGGAADPLSSAEDTPASQGGADDPWLFDDSEGADEWERFRRSLSDTEMEEPAAEPLAEAPAEGPVTQGMDFAGADEEPAVVGPPDPGAVEAAAEHFAEGVRESPQDVERDLLADLDETGQAGPGTIRVEAGDLETAPPPSWEEPTIAGPEDVERPAGAGPRNLPAAVISGGLLAIAAIALLAIGNGPFAVLAAAVILVGQGELYAVMRARGAQPATALGLVVGLLMVVGAYLKGEQIVLFMLFLALTLSALWYMAASPTARKQVVQNVAATLFGIVYVPFLASFALILLRVPQVGRNLLLTVVGLTVLYDVCAYAVGSLWGSRPLAPTISPKKSWEGAIGATFLLLLVSLSLVPLFHPFQKNVGVAVGLALVLAVAAPLGDLVESALKRDLGVKDMGSLLPGHGGILDRIDSILIAAPAAYYFLQVARLDAGLP